MHKSRRWDGSIPPAELTKSQRASRLLYLIIQQWHLSDIAGWHSICKGEQAPTPTAFGDNAVFHSISTHPMLSDLRFAIRQLTKSPGFTAVALMTLALGIGANTALFSITDRLLYRPLSVPAPGRLAILAGVGPDGRLFPSDFNYPLFRDYQREASVFENISATALVSVGIGNSGSGTDRRHALLVSGNYFSMLHVDAALGRTFAPTEGVNIGDAPVVVLAHGLWKSQFAADPGVLGRKVLVDGRAFTVIGVAPREFTGTSRGQVPDLYVPISMYGELTSRRPGGEHPLVSRYYTWHSIIGRLKDGVTRKQAQVAMQALTTRLHAITPDNTPEKLAVLSGAQGIVEEADAARRPLQLLLGISALVLLIACANLAGLQLARASGRAREFAIRIALGASHGRLLCGLLAESILLSLFGGALGVLVAIWLTDLLRRFQPPDQAFELTGDVSLRLLAFTAAISVLTGIVFGLAPAWQAAQTNPAPELKAGAAATDPRGWFRTLRHALVVVQVALSLVVLVCAGLFARSLVSLRRIDPGFSPSRVVVLSLDLSLSKYTLAQAAAFYERLLDRARALPGVESASVASITPLSGHSPGFGFRRVEGYEPKPNEFPWADANFISSDYFRTLGVQLVSGRDFNSTDGAASPRVAIVDEAFVQRYRGGDYSVGWHVYLDGPEPSEVVGIVRSVRGRNLGQAPQQMVFCPVTQKPGAALTLIVRTGIDPAATLAGLRTLVPSLDPGVPVFQARTLNEQISGSLAFQRLDSILLAGFGALTLLLAALGLYGVLAYSISRRTREIGVRLALGARISDIFDLVLRQGFRLLAIGIVLGLGGAIATTTLLRSQLFGVSPFDPLVFGAVTFLLFLVAALACFLPARRAASVDPMVALRAE
jgi:predicted permease